MIREKTYNSISHDFPTLTREEYLRLRNTNFSPSTKITFYTVRVRKLNLITKCYSYDIIPIINIEFKTGQDWEIY